MMCSVCVPRPVGFGAKLSSQVGCASSKRGIGRLQGGGLHHHRRATVVAQSKRYVHQTGGCPHASRRDPPLLRLAIRRADTPPPRPTTSPHTSLQYAAPRRRPVDEGAVLVRAEAPALRRDQPGRPLDVQIAAAILRAQRVCGAQ